MAPSELGESSPKRLKGESWEKVEKIARMEKVGEGLECEGIVAWENSPKGDENESSEEGDIKEEGNESDVMEEDDEIETDEEDLTDDNPLSMKNKEYRAKLRAYRKQIEESQGFDADLFPGFAPGLEGYLVVPCDLDERCPNYPWTWTFCEVANDISLLAIDLFNRFKPNVKLQLVEVVKATHSHSTGYNITFKAKDVLSPTQEEKEYLTRGSKVGELESYCLCVQEKYDRSYIIGTPSERYEGGIIYRNVDDLG